jgi:hypothetical protein
MAIISAKVHGIMDYLYAIALLLAPWLLNLQGDGWETWTMDIVGAAVLIYSLHTNYPVAPLRVIPYSVHLILDVIGGLFLAVSPWLFGFAHIVYLPHVIFGVFDIIVVLLSEKSYRRKTVATIGS